MTDLALFSRAADEYAQAGFIDAAAFNYSRAGRHDKAAECYMQAAQHADAAREYTLAGQGDVAAWIRVHHLGDVVRARAILETLPPTANAVRENETSYRMRRWLRELSRDVASYANDTRQVVPAGSPRRRGRQHHNLHNRALLEFRSVLADLIAYLQGIDHGVADNLTTDDEGFQAIRARVGQFAGRLLESSDDLELTLAVSRLRRRLAVDDVECARAADPDIAVAVAVRRRLAAARCDLTGHGRVGRLLPVLVESRTLLADPQAAAEDDRLRVEEWGVAVAELARRYDQANLLHAAAVRGALPGAAERWRRWTRRVLAVELTWDISDGAMANG